MKIDDSNTCGTTLCASQIETKNKRKVKHPEQYFLHPFTRSIAFRLNLISSQPSVGVMPLFGFLTFCATKTPSLNTKTVAL